MIEPGFTRTNIGGNSQVAGRPIEAYASERNRALDAFRESFANGGDPATVALVVLEALASRSPRLRYPAGREVKLVGLLRKFAPPKLFEKGLRFSLRSSKQGLARGILNH